MFKSQLCLPVFFYKKGKGTHGFEPWAYRTAADCSTTELYPHKITGVDLYTTTLIQLPGEKKKVAFACRDQDSNLGYCGHNAGS